MSDFPIATTMWVRMPGDNRKTAAGWGHVHKIEVTAATNAESLEVARIIYDALREQGIEMVCSRP